MEHSSLLNSILLNMFFTYLGYSCRQKEPQTSRNTKEAAVEAWQSISGEETPGRCHILHTHNTYNCEAELAGLHLR